MRKIRVLYNILIILYNKTIKWEIQAVVVLVEREK